MCRGLILDEEGEIAANPFPKFFNLSEHESNEIPKEPFEVYEKLDGSLGITYWWDNNLYIATRGSFDSEQAIKANQLLTCKYSSSLHLIDSRKTYLFEIIYPDNQVVVDYGEREELVLLAVRDTKTGQDHPIQRIGFPVARRHYYDLRDFKVLERLENKTEEGLVLLFESGFRTKVKFPEYVRLHKALTQISPKTIWEMLKNGDDLALLLNQVPDEFYNWVRSIEKDLKEKYKAIKDYCATKMKFCTALRPREEMATKYRKVAAEYFKTLDYPAVMFQMLDDRDYSQLIWKIIKPEGSNTFRKVEL